MKIGLFLCFSAIIVRCQHRKREKFVLVSLSLTKNNQISFLSPPDV